MMRLSLESNMGFPDSIFIFDIGPISAMQVEIWSIRRALNHIVGT